MNDLPLVRLTTDGKWAGCCDVDCGVKFAQRIELSEFMKAQHPPTAVLDFGAGWVEDRKAGPLPVWRMSLRAWKRISQGYKPAFRRDPNRWYDEEMEAERRGGPERRMDKTWNPSAFSNNANRLPAVVICPKCTRPQLADPVALRCA